MSKTTKDKAGTSAEAGAVDTINSSHQGGIQMRQNDSQKEVNAFAVLMNAAKSPPPPKTQKHSSKGGAASGSRHRFPNAAVINNFARLAADPGKYANEYPGIVIKDNLIAVLDKFPKARFHGLVIARDQRLQGPLDLTANDIPLLLEMQEYAEKWAAEEHEKVLLTEGAHPLERIVFGFHSVPSMKQLHLHVISQVIRF